jgi:hypothetical protein
MKQHRDRQDSPISVVKRERDEHIGGQWLKIRPLVTKCIVSISPQAVRNSFALLAVPVLLAAPAKAITYITPLDAANGSSSIQSGTTDTITNLGYAFITGPSGPFDIDGINISLTSGASSGSGSFKISLNGTDNTIPYSAVASSTVYAADTVNFTTPATANTPFDLILTAADLPNITAYQLLSNTPYSLFVNSQSGSGIALRRTQGLSSNTNDRYAVSNGFTMLDTFRNNTPHYSNSSGPPVSYATFHMSLVGSSSPGPATADVPGPLPILGALAGFRASRLLRKRIKAKV